MSMTFYYAPMSTASLTELVLEELGVPCEKVKLDLKNGDTKKPEFLKLNPNGKVPCLVHDGTALWESCALTMYLGEMFGVERKLYPAAGPVRGEAMKWIAWTNVTLGDAVYRYSRNTMDWVPAEQRNAKAGEVGKQDIAHCMKILDDHLATRQFMLGAEYSLVDAHLGSICDWLQYLKVDISPFAHVTAWATRRAARPAYKKVMASA